VSTGAQYGGTEALAYRLNKDAACAVPLVSAVKRSTGHLTRSQAGPPFTVPAGVVKNGLRPILVYSRGTPRATPDPGGQSDMVVVTATD
jgi:hypothetical protein